MTKDYAHQATLYCVAIMAAIVLPLLTQTSVWLILGVTAVTILQLYRSFSHNPFWQHSVILIKLQPMYVLLALMSAVIFTLYEHEIIWGRDAGTQIFIMTYALKTMEIRTKRDVIVFTLMSYFLLLIYFLYQQNPLWLGYGLIMTWVVTMCLLHWQDERIQSPVRVSCRLAGLLILQAIPMALVAFILFPRTLQPLWALPAAERTVTQGLKDKVEPGDISNLTSSGSVVFRVNFSAAPPERKQLYWRAKVFDVFDGRAWFKGEFSPREYFTLDSLSEPVNYTITLEPHYQKWLPLLDMPSITTPDLNSDFIVSPVEAVNRRQLLHFESVLAFNADKELPPSWFSPYVQLPRGFNPQTRAWVRQLRSDFPDNIEFIKAIAHHVRTHKYSYTLQPPLLGSDSIDDFFFTTKQGYCEHYASSLAFMLRAANIPARLVVGYQGGEWNPVDSYFIINDYDAHAWTEVWLADQGWVRLDPTSWVAPDRIEQGMQQGLPEGSASLARESGIPLAPQLGNEGAWRLQLRHTLDALNHRWNQWVIGYNSTQQQRLLNNVGFDYQHMRELSLALVFVLALIFILLALWVLRPKPSRQVTAWQRCYHQFCRKMAKRGIQRLPHQGPQEFAAQIANERPDLAHQARAICHYYAYLQYGCHRVSEANIARLRWLCRQ